MKCSPARVLCTRPGTFASSWLPQRIRTAFHIKSPVRQRAPVSPVLPVRAPREPRRADRGFRPSSLSPEIQNTRRAESCGRASEGVARVTWLAVDLRGLIALRKCSRGCSRVPRWPVVWRDTPLLPLSFLRFGWAPPAQVVRPTARKKARRRFTVDGPSTRHAHKWGQGTCAVLIADAG